MVEQKQNVEQQAVSQSGADSAASKAKDSLVADAQLTSKDSHSVAHAIEGASHGASQVLPKMEIGGVLSNEIQSNHLRPVFDNRIVIGDQPSDRHGSLDKLLQGETVFRSEGVHKLGTGDYFVDEGGKQTIFTPNGDHVTVNPDGSSTIAGDVRKTSTDSNGVTTVELGDGATIKFDKNGITQVDRDGRSVSITDRPILERPIHFPPDILYRDKTKDGGVWGSGYDGTPGTCPPGDMC